MAKPLLSSKTGGYSLLSFFLVTAGLGVLAFQVILLTSSTEAQGPSWQRFLPGGVGILMLLLFTMTTRKGNIAVYPDRVTGKTAQGKSYELTLKEISEVDLSGSNLWIKGEDGKTLVLDKTPNNRQAAGLIWLLLTYPQSNPDQWKGFPDVSLQTATACLRTFKDESGNPLFGDRGFLIKVEGQTYAFPASKFAPFPKSDTSDQGMTFVPVPSLVQFDPPPAALPIAGFISAFRSTSPTPSDFKELLDILIEAHGGLEVKALEPGEWQGKRNQWQVLVQDFSLPSN